MEDTKLKRNHSSGISMEIKDEDIQVVPEGNICNIITHIPTGVTMTAMLWTKEQLADRIFHSLSYEELVQHFGEYQS